MANKKIYDPNQEVERWKDSFSEEFGRYSGNELNLYLKKKAAEILTHYGISIKEYQIRPTPKVCIK